MNDHDAILAIWQLLDGEYWTPDTLDDIARVMISAGYRIRDTEGIDRDDLAQPVQ